MKTVGVRELKNHFSEYLRRVRLGESILVTDRGEVRRRILSTHAGIDRYVASRGSACAGEAGFGLTRCARGTVICTRLCRARAAAVEGPRNSCLMA
jgi:Antitoxin Phd_YefM, type II toxin-antitoxin system